MPARFLLAAAMVLFAGPVDAQQSTPRDRPLPPPTGSAAIRGRVVDGETGTAVVRARVRLFRPAGPPGSVLTDQAGAFSFASLPHGTYSLFVEKSLYVPARYPDRGQTMRLVNKPLALADGETLDGITVPMFRGGTIAGRVVDVNGDPVEMTPVQALRVSRSAHGRPQNRGFAQTNDLGEFRIAHLEPASYIVFATPHRDTLLDMTDLSGQTNAPDTQAVPTFYPGVQSIDQAQPIALERGRSVSGVEFTLAEATAAVITGAVVDPDGATIATGGGISVRAIMPGIDGGAVEGVGTGVRADGTFRLRLPPGEYELTAHATRPDPKGAESSSESSQLFGITRLTVDGDVAGVVIQLGPGATATGRIVFEGASPLPNIPPRVESMWVVRQSGDGSNCRQGQVTLAPDFTFTVDGLFGTCTASRTGPFGRWFLKSVTFDGQEWLDRTVTFNTGQRFRDVQIVLTDRPTEAAFEVADGRGQPTRDFVGLLFSVDRSRWTNESLSVREFVPGRVGRSGSSSTEEKRAHPDVIRGVPAGDYFAVAIDDIDPELVRDPATLEKLSRAAVRITLVDGLTTVLRLSRTSRPE